MFLHLFTRLAVICDPNNNFLGIIPAWYKYLTLQDDRNGGCKVILDLSKNPTALWLIGLAVADMLIRIAGLIAIGFVIYGGFRYMTSQGEPDKTAAAKNTILNSLIGLVIAVLATTIVAFIGNQFGGSAKSDSGLPSAPVGNPIQTALQIIFGVLGATAVIMIVLGGFQYVFSQGDPQRAAKARSTILYAVIGLVVSISAFTVVSFILGKA